MSDSRDPYAFKGVMFFVAMLMVALGLMAVSVGLWGTTPYSPPPLAFIGLGGAILTGGVMLATHALRL